MALITPTPFWKNVGQVKPNILAPRINWNHPLAKGLVCYWLDTGCGFYIDLVTGRITTKTSTGGTGTFTISPTPWGQGFNFTATTTEQADPAVALNQAWTAPYSLACGFVPNGSASVQYAQLFGLEDSSGNDAFAFYADTAAPTWGISYGNSGSPFSLTPVANTFYVIVGSATGTSAQSSWVNGVPQAGGTATSAYTGSGMHYTFNSNMGNYNSTSGGASYNNAHVFFGAAWLKRALTQAEAILLYTDPYCLLLPSGPSKLLDSFLMYILNQEHFRFRNDSLTVDGTPAWMAAEDAGINPGVNPFRLRISLDNTGAGAPGTPGNYALYVSRNSGAYTLVTTSSANVQAVSAGNSDANDTIIEITRLTEPV